MLQQTQMETVIPYYNRFVERFPDVYTLASADDAEVLKYWQGLGYYRRANYLHQAAKQIVENFAGVFPKDYSEILSLKGVGEYTAGAIHSIAFGQPTPAIDGNVHRVLSRLLSYPGDVTTRKSDTFFKTQLQEMIVYENPSDFTQAMMELGALICKKQPLCEMCPVSKHCSAFVSGTQNDYPVKKPKKPISIEHYITFVYDNSESQTMLIKRPDNGLLANLLAFPQYPSVTLDKAIRAFENEFALTITKADYLFDIDHVFSHKKWLMKVYRVHADPVPKSVLFYDLDNLPEAISKAHSKIIERI